MGLEGAGEAQEDQNVDGQQVRQEQVTRAGAARQQPGEVEAPPPEPAPARQHPATHLEGTDGTPSGQLVIYSDTDR